MLNPLGITILFAVAFVALVVLAIALVRLMRKHRKLKSDYEDLAEIVHGLNNDFRDLYTSTQTTDERITATNEQMGLLIEKVSNFQQVEPTNHPYSLAIQKVRSGASVSELMQTSGLSQDEATLLIRLHGSKTQ
jgi:cell division protein FtsL